MMGGHNKNPEVAEEMLSKIKSCAKKVMGLDDGISDEDFEKEFDKQCCSMDGENKSAEEKRQKIKYCINKGNVSFSVS